MSTFLPSSLPHNFKISSVRLLDIDLDTVLLLLISACSSINDNTYIEDEPELDDLTAVSIPVNKNSLSMTTSSASVADSSVNIFIRSFSVPEKFRPSNIALSSAIATCPDMYGLSKDSKNTNSTIIDLTSIKKSSNLEEVITA